MHARVVFRHEDCEPLPELLQGEQLAPIYFSLQLLRSLLIVAAAPAGELALELLRDVEEPALDWLRAGAIGNGVNDADIEMAEDAGELGVIVNLADLLDLAVEVVRVIILSVVDIDGAGAAVGEDGVAEGNCNGARIRLDVDMPAGDFAAAEIHPCGEPRPEDPLAV